MSRSVVVVCDYSPTFLGGAQRAMRNQVIALARAGDRVTVVIPVPPVDWVPADVSVEIRPAQSRGPRLAGMPIIRNSAARRAWFRDLFHDCAVDVVIVHSEFGLAASAVDAAREVGIGSVHVVHTFFWAAPAHPPAPIARVAAAVLTWLHRGATASPILVRGRLAEHPLDDALRGMTFAIASRATHVVSPSAHQAAALRAAGLARVHAVSNAIISDSASVVPFYFDRRPLRLVWAGRCTPEKGLMLAVRAVLAAEQSLGVNAIELHVAGEGPQLRAARAAGADSSAMRWYGRVSAHHVGILLADADAVIVSSLGFDNQPMVALEAFHVGRPVIVVDPQLAGEFRGAAILAESPSVPALAGLLVRLSLNREVLTRAGNAARDEARHSTARAHVDALLGVAGLADDEGE